MVMYRIASIRPDAESTIPNDNQVVALEDRDNPAFYAEVIVSGADLLSNVPDSLEAIFCGVPNYTPNDAGLTCA